MNSEQLDLVVRPENGEDSRVWRFVTPELKKDQQGIANYEIKLDGAKVLIQALLGTKRGKNGSGDVATGAIVESDKSIGIVLQVIDALSRHDEDSWPSLRQGPQFNRLDQFGSTELPDVVFANFIRQIGFLEQGWHARYLSRGLSQQDLWTERSRGLNDTSFPVAECISRDAVLDLPKIQAISKESWLKSILDSNGFEPFWINGITSVGCLILDKEHDASFEGKRRAVFSSFDSLADTQVDWYPRHVQPGSDVFFPDHDVNGIVEATFAEVGISGIDQYRMRSRNLYATFDTEMGKGSLKSTARAALRTEPLQLVGSNFGVVAATDGYMYPSRDPLHRKSDVRLSPRFGKLPKGIEQRTDDYLAIKVQVSFR